MAQKIRYHFAGERASDARLVSVSPTSDTLTTLDLCVDLAHFTPHIFSAQEEAWVVLTASCAPSDPNLLIRLHPRARPARPLSLDCDSSSTALTSSFFAIGIARSHAGPNHGPLWRTALQLGAAFTFTIGAAYSLRVDARADVYKHLRSVPCLAYADEEAFWRARAVGADVVAVEVGGEDLGSFVHPRRAVYVLGAEREGLGKEVVERCDRHVSIAVAEGRPGSMNVAAAAAVVMWDRVGKERMRAKERVEATAKDNWKGWEVKGQERKYRRRDEKKGGDVEVRE